MASFGIHIDRRILRAFYIQYVAVLLILLVFCVGSAYRDSRSVPIHLSLIDTETPAVPFGSMRYPEFFTSTMSSEIRDHRGAEAVFEVLRNHDVRAVFMISAPISDDSKVVAVAAHTRARTVKARAIQSHVPSEAIQVVIVPSLRPSSEVSVSFESLEVPDATS